jgi:hypothetical protein
MSLSEVSQSNTNVRLSGALQAAMHAAQQQVDDKASATTPHRFGTSKPDSKAVTYQTQVKAKNLHSAPGRFDGLSAAKTSVMRSTSNLQSPNSNEKIASTSETPKSATIAAKASFTQTRLVDGSNGRSFASSILNPRISHNTSTPSLVAAQAATGNSTPSASRPNGLVENADLGAKISIQSTSGSKRSQPLPRESLLLQSPPPFYSLPQATESAPMLLQFHNVGPYSTNVPLRIDFTRKKYLSSSFEDLPTRGAATAMTSRNASQTSLSTLGSSSNRSVSEDSISSQKRPVHLKTTLRKGGSQEREREHKINGIQELTEREKKRYQGLWAANQPRSAILYASQGTLYLDRLVVRELWNRSKLPREVLRHIW